ncbi:hypothetical protein CDLVIII_2155 [Clostridium sp. DL-VIII]|uniref:hypothetical protein n=1 Tax=Clostridium sp. DL-VIII TaxID=641107 RepID=UPI00023AFAF6|nr:hypothetical protein [Clostridium sp. DL-VIII]EHI98817.1 hypothetical protein CDLVIII_2155 [Clostridium sp. DL-VIII]
MKEREEVIKEYFNSWVIRDESVLEKVFEEDIMYIECYGPAYKGIGQVKKWVTEWYKHGRVIVWNINEFVHNERYSICDWYFECEYDGKLDGFNGVSWIEFSERNKIIKLREYQSKVPNYFPYDTK